MSSWSESEDCPKCGGEDSLKTYGENRPIFTVCGICLKCGYSYSTMDKQLTLDEVNEERPNYGLEPLTELKPQIHP